MNPYLPSHQKQETFLRDLPKEERKKLVLSGNSTAGHLTVFMYEHPILFWIGATLALGAFLLGCWTCIQA